MEMRRDTKNCPFCGEEILAVAIKCKHCGERVAPSGSATTPPHPRVRAPRLSWTPKLVWTLGLVALLGLATVVVFAMRDSDFVVSLHRDVQWHRVWQDRHVEKERARVVELYARLRKSHPGDPRYAYLAARALPPGQEQFDSFDAAAREFPDDPWVVWGHASAVEAKQGRTAALDLRLRALSMFPEGAPTELLSVVIDESARTSKWEVLGSLYEQYASKINADGDAACSMAMAQFRSGNAEAALAWQHRAEERGCKRVGDLGATISGMKAIGMAADVLNGRVSLSRGNSSVELNGVRVSTSQGGSSVQLNLVYRHADPDSTIFGSECFISTKSNRKIKSDTLGFVDVARYSSTPLQLSFDVPAGEVVDSLVIPTGLKFTNSGAPILVTLPLGPDQEDRLDGLPDGKIVTANELLHHVGTDVSLEDLHTWTGLPLRNGDALVAITSELRAVIAKGLSGRTASAAILPK